MGGYTFAQWSIDLRYAIAGFLVDGLVGVTGVGGGSLMTPILIVLFGVPPRNCSRNGPFVRGNYQDRWQLRAWLQRHD